MRLLVLSFFPAFAPATSGGAVRLLGLYGAMSRFCQVDLLSSTARGDGPIEHVQHGPNFREIRVPKEIAYEKHWNDLSPMAQGVDPTGPAFAELARRDNSFLRAFLDAYANADVIVHESPFTANIDILAGLDDKPRVYASHNVETRLARDMFPGPQGAPLRDLVARLESRLLSTADLVGHCAHEDLAVFRAMAPDVDERAIHLPNGSDWMPTSDRRRVTEPSAVFIGSGHRPNVEAVDYIVRHLAPALPHVRFDLIGDCAPAGRPAQNVQSHGLVSEAEKASIMAQAATAIIPVTSGSGSSLKVLDFAATGLPIVSTAFGMRGFDAEPGRHYTAAANLEAFPATLRATLAALDAAHERASAFRTFAEERFAWHAIAQRLHAALQAKLRDASGRDARRVLVLNDSDISEGHGGGLSRMRGLYAGVARRRPVNVLSYASGDEIAQREISNGIRTLLLPKSPGHRAEAEACARRYHASANDIIAARHTLGEPLMVKAYRALRPNAEPIVAEHPYLASLPVAHGDRFIYSSHNVERSLKAQLLATHPDRDSLLATVRTCELQAVENADMLVTCSRQDALDMTISARRAPGAAVIPNGAPAPDDEPADPIPRTRRRVVFMGSAHPPNVAAARLIVTQIAPDAQHIDFVLIGSICGSVSTPLPDNVQLAGELSESAKSTLLWTCDLALNLVLQGGGSNVKMADYLAHGLPILTTPVGMRGFNHIDSPAIRIADISQFGPTMDNILAGTSQSQLRQEARRVFSAHFDIAVLSERFSHAILDASAPDRRLRVLATTYRLATNPIGGAEAHFLRLIEALADTGAAQIDVVAPEITNIRDTGRFTTEYTFDRNSGAGLAHPAIRWARFPLSATEQPTQSMQALESSDRTFGMMLSAKEDTQEDRLAALAAAYRLSRGKQSVSLTDVRGPYASEMSEFLASAIHDYDLVITHNCVFRTCVETISLACAAGVPSVVIPQAHLDDGYYYWPDTLRAIENASIAIVSPRQAVEQLRALDIVSAHFLPPGIDADEKFTDEDVSDFRRVHAATGPFFLVLGRKTGSKRHDLVIDALRNIRQRMDVDLVLIGPDEDLRPVNADDAIFLGAQPRSVVRGALMTCVGLVTMSESESFGIVVLEAWMAGKPVIANRATAAFRDLVQDGVNGRLVTSATDLAKAMEALLRDPVMAAEMGHKGRRRALAFGWKAIGQEFSRLCLQLAGSSRQRPQRQAGSDVEEQ